MRTFWIILASHLLLGSGCTSGEYTTTPDMTTPDMTSLSKNMSNPVCGQTIPINDGPQKGCKCQVQCSGATVSGCAIILQSSTAETCNGLDDNCNGSVDDGAMPGTSNYQTSPYTYSKSWDLNCSDHIEFGIPITATQFMSLDPIVGNSELNCTQSEMDTRCANGNADRATCESLGVICIDVSGGTNIANTICGKNSTLVYKCKYNSAGTPKCTANMTAENSVKIYCR